MLEKNMQCATAYLQRDVDINLYTKFFILRKKELNHNIFYKITIPMIYFCVIKLVALSTNTVISHNLGLSELREVGPVYVCSEWLILESSGSSRILLIHVSWLGVGRLRLGWGWKNWGSLGIFLFLCGLFSLEASGKLVLYVCLPRAPKCIS